MVTCIAFDKVPPVPTDVCLGTSVCVAKGVSRKELELSFGLSSRRRVTRDDALIFDCFKLGSKYVLITYSSQGHPSAQPEQIDVALVPQASCKAPVVAKRHIDVSLLPVSIGSSETFVVTKFGEPGRVWTAENSRQGINRNEKGLVYGALDSNEFVLIVLKNGAVTRVMGSISP